jgi:circadian clock protein KaiB
MIGSQDELQRRLIEAAAQKDHQSYVLRLYVAGNTSKSLRAISNLRRICETYLPGRVELEVIDIYQNDDELQNEQVVAAPMLVKTLPPPLRRLVGDLSDEGRVLLALSLTPDEEGER